VTSIDPKLDELRADLAARSPDPAKGHRLLDPFWRLFGRDSQTLARAERTREIERSARALASIPQNPGAGRVVHTGADPSQKRRKSADS
jgi:hypothetical protein